MKTATKNAASKSCAKKKTACSEKKSAASTPAVKKAGAKAVVKPAVSAPASKKTVKKAAVSKTSVKESGQKVTRIVAHVDVGWGNMLYIRGEGAGLSWEQGVPMICNNDTEWHWIAETEAGPISFKFLVNDEVWSLGENVTINAGDVHFSEPTF